MRKIFASLFIAALAIFFPVAAFAQTSVSVTAQVPSNVSGTLSTVVANLVQLPADGTSLVIITVTLVDSLGTPQNAKDVALSSNRGSVDIIGAYSGNTLTESATGTSNASGIIRFAVRSYAPGQATFTAFADGEVTLNEKPTVAFTPLPAVKNISVTVTIPPILPGKDTITIIEPQPTVTTNEPSDIANRQLVSTQLDIRIPFWVFLAVIIFILLNPTLLVLVIYLISKVRRGFRVESEYKTKEENLLKQVVQLEQQVATNQQFAYQNDQKLSQQIQETKTELTETIDKGVESAIAKVEERRENPELPESEA